MKSLKFLLVGLLLTNQALAYTPTIKTQLRGDFVMDEVQTTATKGAKKSEEETSNFDMTYVRFDVKGKVKEDLSYRVKFRLNDKNGLTRDNTDQVGHGVDYAYIEHKLLNGVKVRLGKQYFNLGGFEGQYSSKETYSQGSLSWNNSDFYRTGIGFFYKLGNHHFNFQAVNPDDNTAKKDTAYGIQAIFSFASGMLKPVISWHKDTTHVDKTIGLQLNNGGFSLELDHTMTEFDKTYEASGVLKSKADEHTSTTAIVKYKTGKWSPQIKYTKADTKLDYKAYDSTHIVLEYFPYTDGTLRYHVAYATKKNEARDTSSKDYKVEGKTITTGFALSF